MAFRNPVRYLPADHIVGQIQGTQLAADAIDGKVITGATVQTAATGRRIVMAPDGATYYYTGAAGELDPGRIQPVGGANPSIGLYGPRLDEMEDYGLELSEVGASTKALLSTDSFTVVGDQNVAGQLLAGNIKWGSVTITPVANTNTSTTVSGVGLADGGSFRVWLCANSTAPGTITELTATGASSDGFTLWIYRNSASPVNVWWLMTSK